MGIFVSLAMPQGLAVPAGILQVGGDPGDTALFDFFEGAKIGLGGVAFGGERQVDGGLGQVVLGLGEANPGKGLGGGDRLDQGLGVGEADILRGQYQQAPDDEFGVLAGVEHAGQPIEGGVDIGTPHAFDEGGNGIVMGISVTIIQHGPGLDGFLGYLQIEINAAVGCGRGAEDGQLQGIEGVAQIAAGQISQMLQGLGRGGDRIGAQAAVFILQGPMQREPDLLPGKRLEDEDPGPGEQGADDLEIRVFGGGADEDQRAFFDMGEQGVLLSFIEAVDFVHQDDGAAPPGALFLSLGHYLPDILDTAEHGAQAGKMALGQASNNMSQGGFAATRGSPEDKRGKQLVGFNGPAQQAAGADNVLLADEFRESARAHSSR